MTQPTVSSLQEESDDLKARQRTHIWYARHYGKLHHWARTMLPEPWSTQFFNCVANGLYDSVTDVGEPYMCSIGQIVPSGYFKLDTASEQILHDQSMRAENAEIALTAANTRIAELEETITSRESMLDRLNASNDNQLRRIDELEAQWKPIKIRELEDNKKGPAKD